MIVIATCHDWPRLSASEALLAEALRCSGAEVATAPWNDGTGPFEGAELVLLRACWDYHKAPTRFLAWLDALESAGIRVLNPPALVRWNFDKRYLLAMQDARVRVPRTRLVSPREHAAIAEVMREEGWRRAVLKPVSGQSGFHVERLELAERSRWPVSGMPTDVALLQEFQADIGGLGETALIFFDGRYSHAVRKTIAAGEWRANSQFGAGWRATAVSAPVVEQARAALAAAPGASLYARVDGIVRGDDFTLLELELIEPGLYLDSDPGAATRFAEATLGRLGK